MVHQNKAAARQQKQEKHKSAFGRKPREVFQPVDEQVEDNPQHGTHQHALYQAVKVILPCEAFDFFYQFVRCRHIQFRINCKITEIFAKLAFFANFGEHFFFDDGGGDP